LEILSEKEDEPRLEIGIGAGYTGGYTMPFEPRGTDELEKWAEEEYSRLPKCARCGKIIEDLDSAFRIEDFDGVFCSGLCAEKTWCEYHCE